METITNAIELKKAIQLLKIKQTEEGILLKEQCKITYDSLQPINLIKSTITDLVTPNLTKNIVDATLSLATGYVSKKIVIGDTYNPIKQLLGTILQTAVTSLVAKNTGGIKLVTLNLISTVLNKINAQKTSVDNTN